MSAQTKAIEPLTPEDQFLSAKQAAFLVPGIGPPHIRTVYRWASEGVINRKTGEVIKLRTGRVGNRWYTRRSWLAEFLTACATETADTTGGE